MDMLWRHEIFLPVSYLVSLPHLSVSLFPLFLLDGGIALESNTVYIYNSFFYKTIVYGYYIIYIIIPPFRICFSRDNHIIRPSKFYYKYPSIYTYFMGIVASIT